LSGIDLHFEPGKFNMVLGPNGSGKSTFLKIFSGEITGHQGTIFYGTQNIKNIKKEVLAKHRAVMSQQPELSFPLSVEEVVMMGRYPHFDLNPGKKDIGICTEVMQRMNLVDFKFRNYLTLSGGEKQRVQFARVLAQVWETPADGYRYLFLDEPLASLDIKYQQQFLHLASTFADARTVLVAVIHDINLAIQYGDALFFLKNGELVAAGPPAGIVTEALVENVFNVQTKIIVNPETGLPLMIYPTLQNLG
jgi:iron complex transport system ATP-binding protein